MKVKRVSAYGLFAAILAFGMMAASCDNNNNPMRPDGGSLYDFQGFLAGLPLGVLAGGGSWPVWSTGNILSVVELDDRRALRVSSGGAHGVDLLLAGANSLGVSQGDWLEIHGRIIVIATGEAPETSSFPSMWPFQLAALRSALGQDPSSNLVSASIIPPSPEFVLHRVIRSVDLVQVGWPPGPSLRLVNEPSNPGTAMFVTDILVLR